MLIFSYLWYDLKTRKGGDWFKSPVIILFLINLSFPKIPFPTVVESKLFLHSDILTSMKDEYVKMSRSYFLSDLVWHPQYFSTLLSAEHSKVQLNPSKKPFVTQFTPNKLKGKHKITIPTGLHHITHFKYLLRRWSFILWINQILLMSELWTFKKSDSIELNHNLLCY